MGTPTGAHSGPLPESRESRDRALENGKFSNLRLEGFRPSKPDASGARGAKNKAMAAASTEVTNPSVPPRSAAAGTVVAPTRAGAAPRMLILWMVLAIAVIAGIAYWDEEREARAALDEFAGEQSTLAEGLSRALAERLAVIERDTLEGARDLPNGDERALARGVRVRRADTTTPHDPSVFQFAPAASLVATVPIARVLNAIRAVDRPGALAVFVRVPSENTWVAASDARHLEAPFLSDAVQHGHHSAQLTRPDAASLGLPARMAMAGLSRVDAGALGTWDVAVVATAMAERDRERRAQIRLLLSVALASSLVLAFGGLALKKQRKELELTRDAQLIDAEKLATMGALATGIAHEVATPLGVILARAEQITARGSTDERTGRAAKAITEQAERIHEVMRAFLSLARGETPTLEPSEPARLATEALALVEHRFAKAGVTLTFQKADELPVIACDRRLFEQVLVNLLLNACEACDEGGEVRLSIRADAEHVVFIVTDTGVGISPEAAAQATTPFFTTKPEGTGLGLAIANEIVRHHCGTLTLRARNDAPGTEAIVEVKRG